MNRRVYLAQLAGAGAVGAFALNSGAAAQTPNGPIQLHVELEVLSGREKEVEQNFRKVFVPTIRKQPGFVDVRLLRFTKAYAGKEVAPYRLIISFETDGLRQKWVDNPEHQRAWPSIGRTLRSEPSIVVLYDTV